MAPRKSATSSKKKSATQLKLDRLPLLNAQEAQEHISTHINFPGSFWVGQMTAEEKTTMYQCVVRDYILLHQFTPMHKAAAFELISFLAQLSCQRSYQIRSDLNKFKCYNKS